VALLPKNPQKPYGVFLSLASKAGRAQGCLPFRLSAVTNKSKAK
jgi:hypothetical protein